MARIFSFSSIMGLPFVSFLLLAPREALSFYCSGEQEVTVTGNSLSTTYGKVVIVGDSLLDGNGSTEGWFEETLSRSLDNTVVVNNAIGGFTLDEITDSVACSCFTTCKWSIVNGGINGMMEQSVSKTITQMQNLVQRELDSAGNQGVVIQGYVPDCNIYASGSRFDAIMDGYRDYAAATKNVWFVDPRNIGLPGHELMGRPCDDTNNVYRIQEDNSHPTPLSGEVMAIMIADIIKSQPNNDSGGDNSNSENDNVENEDVDGEGGEGTSNEGNDSGDVESSGSNDVVENESGDGEDGDGNSNDIDNSSDIESLGSNEDGDIGEDNDSGSFQSSDNENSRSDDAQSSGSNDAGNNGSNDNAESSRSDDGDIGDNGSNDSGSSRSTDGENESNDGSNDKSNDESESNDIEPDDEEMSEEENHGNESDCQDDASFRFGKNKNRSCERVAAMAQSSQQRVCRKRHISKRCPRACGMCSDTETNGDNDAPSDCKDDLRFRFRNRKGKSCKWVKRIAKTRPRICNQMSEGIKVRTACPLACGAC